MSVFVVGNGSLAKNSQVFKNNKCVYNKTLGHTYDIEQLVQMLNGGMLIFVIEEGGPRIANNRVFKHGKCIYNKTLGFAYSVEEIVEVLNKYANE